MLTGAVLIPFQVAEVDKVRKSAEDARQQPVEEDKNFARNIIAFDFETEVSAPLQSPIAPRRFLTLDNRSVSGVT